MSMSEVNKTEEEKRIEKYTEEMIRERGQKEIERSEKAMISFLKVSVVAVLIVAIGVFLSFIKVSPSSNLHDLYDFAVSLFSFAGTVAVIVLMFEVVALIERFLSPSTDTLRYKRLMEEKERYNKQRKKTVRL